MVEESNVVTSILGNQSDQNRGKPTTKLPYLKRYSHNLSLYVKNKFSDIQITGRDIEIDQVIKSLLLVGKNNPLLIGEAGVGKTALVEGLAKRILEGSVPTRLLNKEIVVLTASSLKSTKDGESFENKLDHIINELKSVNGKYILFLDEIHTFMSSQGESNSDGGNTLKPAMARGDIQLIGATTIDEYHAYIEKDRALERRFQLIELDEPTPKVTLDILKNNYKKFEREHGVLYSTKILKKSVELAEKYLPSRKFPDKALDIVDQVGAAAELNGIYKISDKLLVETVSEMSKVPIARVSENQATSLLNLPSVIKRRVKGQDEAVELVANAVIRGQSHLQDPKKPIASFMLLGTTGVGKTELAMTLANEMFDAGENSSKYLRLDMSEYKTLDSVGRLRGDINQKGKLTEAVKHNPYSLLLFDEIEKAHPEVMDLFLQILDYGVLSDQYDKKVDFTHTIIIFTTNLGAELIKERETFKTGAEAKRDKKIQKHQIIQELLKFLRPELINRIDRIVMMHMLSERDITEIADNELQKVLDRFAKYYPNLRLSFKRSEILGFLSRIGYDRDNGARPLKRAIEDRFTDPLSKGALKYSNKNQKVVAEIKLKGQPPVYEEKIKTISDTQHIEVKYYEDDGVDQHE